MVNVFDEKTLQLGRFRQGKYTNESIKATYVHNVKRLAEMMPKIKSAGYNLFRISSAMFPLADQVDNSLWNNPEVIAHLKVAGEYINQGSTWLGKKLNPKSKVKNVDDLLRELGRKFAEVKKSTEDEITDKVQTAVKEVKARVRK